MFIQMYLYFQPRELELDLRPWNLKVKPNLLAQNLHAYSFSEIKLKLKSVDVLTYVQTVNTLLILTKWRVFKAFQKVNT